jgi:hypothetical protein
MERLFFHAVEDGCLELAQLMAPWVTEWGGYYFPKTDSKALLQYCLELPMPMECFDRCMWWLAGEDKLETMQWLLQNRTRPEAPKLIDVDSPYELEEALARRSTAVAELILTDHRLDLTANCQILDAALAAYGASHSMVQLIVARMDPDVARGCIEDHFLCLKIVALCCANDLPALVKLDETLLGTPQPESNLGRRYRVLEAVLAVNHGSWNECARHIIGLFHWDDMADQVLSLFTPQRSGTGAV